MPYYQGDYYQGDYYQGDVFGFLKRVGRTAVGAVRGFVRGGPVGAISGAAEAAFKRSGKTTLPAPPEMSLPAPMITPRMLPPGPTMAVDVPKGTPGAVKQPGISGVIERTLPFGQSGYIPGAALGQGAPAGWHWNKSFSYAKGLPAGSFLVRNRSMNPLNPRALRRTVRRQRQAVGLMRGVLAGSGYTIKRTGLPGKGRKSRRR